LFWFCDVIGLFSAASLCVLSGDLKIVDGDLIAPVLVTAEGDLDLD
jgi:hypothetical protein